MIISMIKKNRRKLRNTDFMFGFCNKISSFLSFKKKLEEDKGCFG